MKLSLADDVRENLKVVPLAGTRIETSLEVLGSDICKVVPLAGTRIETLGDKPNVGIAWVVPLAGTRIETGTVEHKSTVLACRPPRGDAD